MKRKLNPFWCLAVLTLVVGSAYAAKKPNILVIWGDDIGPHNVSAYNNGIIGGVRPTHYTIFVESVGLNFPFKKSSKKF